MRETRFGCWLRCGTTFKLVSLSRPLLCRSRTTTRMLQIAENESRAGGVVWERAETRAKARRDGGTRRERLVASWKRSEGLLRKIPFLIYIYTPGEGERDYYKKELR